MREQHHTDRFPGALPSKWTLAVSIRDSRWLLASALAVVLLLLYFAASRTSLLPAYYRIPAPFPSSAATPEARRHQDLEYLANELPRLHRDAFHRVSREAFEAAVAKLKVAAAGMTEFEFVLGVMRIVAMVGDAHTEAIPPRSVELRQCPLKLDWFANGLFVTDARSSDRDLIGARLVEVGEMEIEQAIAAVAEVIAHENRPSLEKQVPRALLNPELLAALGVQRSPEVGRYGFELPNGSRAIREMRPVEYSEYLEIWQTESSRAATPLFQRRRDDAYWFERLADRDAVYVRFRRCAEMPSPSFREFTAQVFDVADRHGVSRLIVDFRENGGGDSGVFQPFLKRLLGHPRFDRGGHLYVIVGRRTFSSAVLNAAELRRDTKAILVGEPTSGAPNHFGEVRAFVLPFSRLIIRYSTKYFEPLPGFRGTQLDPDVLIRPTFEDSMAGRDPVLETILRGGAVTTNPRATR